MGYYIRVLGKTNPTISVDKLTDALKAENLDASIEVEVEFGAPAEWIQLLVRDKDDRNLILIEKTDMVEGEFELAEIEEFKEEVVDCKPTSAANWLVDFFDKVKVIYTFQILSAVDNDESWNIVGAIKTEIWRATEGIIQADNEGFTNEQGYHILWQFSDDVSGPWYMAVLDSSGNFVNFKMDLDDKKQRKDFLDGKVPKGAELV
ncbi:MAG: hypothetical protein QM762_18075 [Chryseolinea sp.]